MATLKFPGGALFFDCAEFLLPAGGQAVFSAPLIDQQKVELSLDMGGDSAPSLFIAVYCLQGHAEQFRQLFLCLTKLFSGKTEFFLGQEWYLVTLN